MGRLVAIEGIDGSGKSTVTRRLATELAQTGHDVHVTREPTDTGLGRRVREAIRGRVHPVAQALLFLSDHRRHRTEVAGLLADRHVLSDRWSDSCFAYQAATLRDHVEDPLSWLLRGAGDDLRPDLVVLLDLEVEAALSRVSDRGPAEGFERKELLGRVRANYHDLADRFGNYVFVDADRPLAAVVEECTGRVRSLLGAGEDPL